MADTKLKPCPFCGEKPISYIKTRRDMSHDCIIFSIICVKCDIKKEITVTSGLSFDQMLNTYNDVAEFWNRRAEVTAIPSSSKEEALALEYEGDGYDDNGEIIYDTAYCPICRYHYEVDYDTHDNYCRNCGQKLDWKMDGGDSYDN